MDKKAQLLEFCGHVKDEYLKCVNDDVCFDPKILKFKAKTNFDHVRDYKISEEIKNKCDDNSLFTKCLEMKYNNLLDFNESRLLDLFSKKFDQLGAPQNK